MPSLKILCTRKTASPQAHLGISHVGGANPSNLPWTLAVADAIHTIELKQYNFYAMRGDGKRTDVVVARTADGQKYLKCAADSDQGDTLGALPDCP